MSEYYQIIQYTTRYRGGVDWLELNVYAEGGFLGVRYIYIIVCNNTQLSSSSTLMNMVSLQGYAWLVGVWATSMLAKEVFNKSISYQLGSIAFVIPSLD